MNYLAKRRWRRYRQRYAQQTLNSHDGAVVTDELLALWRHFHLPDLVNWPAAVRHSRELEVWRPSIHHWLADFRQHNTAIDRQRDQWLEQQAVEQISPQVVSLDLYLADDDGYPIDELTALTQIRRLLTWHWGLLRPQPDLYYQRLSTRYYQDLIALTGTLIAPSTNEETRM